MEKRFIQKEVERAPAILSAQPSPAPASAIIVKVFLPRATPPGRYLKMQLNRMLTLRPWSSSRGSWSDCRCVISRYERLSEGGVTPPPGWPGWNLGIASNRPASLKLKLDGLGRRCRLGFSKRDTCEPAMEDAVCFSLCRWYSGSEMGPGWL